MSRFTTSNSTYGSCYTRSGNTQLRSPSTAMQIQRPLRDTTTVAGNRRADRTDVSPPPRRSIANQTAESDKRPKGLRNLRNTCYINSVLQILFEILQLPTGDQSKPVSDTFMELKESHAEGDIIHLKQLLEKHLPFVCGHHQQDAQQFLTGMLEVINQENREGTGNQKKPIQLMEVSPELTVKQNWGRFFKQMERVDSSPILGQFSGENYLELKCKLNHNKYRFERFVTLTLALPEKGGPFLLTDLLQHYFTEELIDGVQCQKCKRKGPAHRSVRLYNEPKILVLHLNRFQQGYYSNIKNKGSIKFDRTLTLPKNVMHTDKQKDPIRYDLIGTINHVGSINAGHYYAVKKDIIEGEERWLMCNDDVIRDTGINEHGNLSEYAYILIYRRG